MKSKEHPTLEQIKGYGNQSLKKKEDDEVGRHLLLCEDCRKLLPVPTKEQFLAAIFGKSRMLKEQ